MGRNEIGDQTLGVAKVQHVYIYIYTAYGLTSTLLLGTINIVVQECSRMIPEERPPLSLSLCSMKLCAQQGKSKLKSKSNPLTLLWALLHFTGRITQKKNTHTSQPRRGGEACLGRSQRSQGPSPTPGAGNVGSFPSVERERIEMQMINTLEIRVPGIFLATGPRSSHLLDV